MAILTMEMRKIAHFDCALTTEIFALDRLFHFSHYDSARNSIPFNFMEMDAADIMTARTMVIWKLNSSGSRFTQNLIGGFCFGSVAMRLISK